MKFFKNKKKLLVYVILAAAAAGLYFKYFKKEDTITYITQPVRRQNVEKVVNATGEVKAVDLVTVGAQVSGKIEKLYVSIGQTVKMGDMIAEIDSTTQQNDVDIAKAKMSSYQAQLKAAKTSLKIARKQYQRMQSLKKQNAASTEDLENAEDGYESAMSKVAEIEASLKETEISLSTAETNLGYTKITAPFRCRSKWGRRSTRRWIRRRSCRLPILIRWRFILKFRKATSATSSRG